MASTPPINYLAVLLTGWILFVGFKVTVHTVLNEFLIMTVMALIIGLWAPGGLGGGDVGFVAG